MTNIHNRWATEEPMVITHDPAKDDNRPWHQVYRERTRKPGLILQRAYALSRQGRWDRMCSYVIWELSQPVSGDPAMDQVRELHRVVKSVESINQLSQTHMNSARFRMEAGYPELAFARLGWLLELIPTDHHKHAEVTALVAYFQQRKQQ